MRLAKWSSYITFFISIISLIFIMLFNDGNNLIYDISLALFGSALVGFLIAILQYDSEKKKVLESFYKLSLDITKELTKIKYYHIDSNREKIINNLRKHAPDILVEDYDFFQNDKDFLDCINSYASFGKIEIENFKSAFASLDFLVGNMFFRKWIEENVYKKIIEIEKQIENEKSIFQLFESYRDPIHCLDSILKLNDFFFIKQSDNSITVYNQVYDNCEKVIEQLRCKMHGQKYTPTEHKLIVYIEKTIHTKV